MTGNEREMNHGRRDEAMSLGLTVLNFDSRGLYLTLLDQHSNIASARLGLGGLLLLQRAQSLHTQPNGQNGACQYHDPCVGMHPAGYTDRSWT